ncbi:MAG: hypothetical protein U9R16_03205 [Campylobacterota bacterium]|nr:hypothetical protein [Campylobacterota bacterium]
MINFKQLLLTLLFISSLNADYLLYLEKDKGDEIKTYCIVYYDYRI